MAAVTPSASSPLAEEARAATITVILADTVLMAVLIGITTVSGQQRYERRIGARTGARDTP